MKTVSVVMPAYNYARYIRESIDSVLAQTHAPLEVIVVDDGSTDDTPAVLASYGDRIRVIRQQNAGVAAARNAGLAVARGEYMAFIDSDDIWLPRKLELQLARFEADPTLGLVHCGIEIFDDAGRTLEVVTRGEEGWLAEGMLRMDEGVLTGPGSGILVPRRVAEEVGGYDVRLAPSEDWDFCYRIVSRYRAGFVPGPLLRYRMHGSGGHLNIARMEHGMLLAFEKAFAAGGPELRKLRRPAYGRLHRILAGSYFTSHQFGAFFRHVLKSLGYDPRNLGYLAAYPWRVIRRRRAATPAA